MQKLSKEDVLFFFFTTLHVNVFSRFAIPHFISSRRKRYRFHLYHAKSVNEIYIAKYIRIYYASNLKRGNIQTSTSNMAETRLIH